MEAARARASIARTESRAVGSWRRAMRLFDSSSHDLDSNVLHDVRRAAWLPHVNLRELQLGRDGALAHLEAVLAGGSGDPERSVYGPNTRHHLVPMDAWWFIISKKSSRKTLGEGAGLT